MNTIIKIVFALLLALVSHSTVTAQQETMYIMIDGNISYKQAVSDIDSIIFYTPTTGNSTTDPRDGKVYQTVTIGNQEWMAENLAYAPSSGNFWAYGDDNSNAEIYGYLYDWETAQDACPTGWHLPSDAEWTELTDYLGGVSVAGGKLKEAGYTHWYRPNAGATNETLFRALPGGSRSDDGIFNDIGKFGFWWSVTEYDTDNAYYRNVYYTVANVGRNNFSKEFGFSVRCVKD